MGILDGLLSRVKNIGDGLTDGSLMRGVLMPYEGEILAKQKEQLFEGKSVTGEDMRPYYSEDLKPRGYFHSAQSAGRYAAWKQDLSYPYSAQRNPDAPNLYINGKFHSELGIDMGPDRVNIIDTTAKAKEIMSKYAGQFGLNWSKWNEILIMRGYNDLMNTIKQELYV